MIEIEHRSFEDTLTACETRGGVDLIVTSPPYPDARPGQYLGDAPHDWTWPDYQRLGDYVARALRPGGFCAINIDGPIRTRRKGIGSERDLIAFRLAIDWAERVGLRYVEHCAYVRDGTPGLFGHRWRSGWEPVHVFQRPSSADGYFDVRGYEIPAVQAGKMQRPGKNRHGDGRRLQVAHHVQRESKPITTAISGRLASESQEHPAPFSRALADAFVLCYCPPGGTTCDPFVGSGTVALSCARNGRDFIGGDLGERAEDLARGRSAGRWADIALERALAELSRPKQGALAL